jgi:diguanylate cyclase (GGDEF)-like protein/PAS domain S-box-containing protein
VDIAPLPPDEPDRLASLRAYRILDTAPDPRFDAITRIAARVLGTPMASIALIDEARQWFKSSIGPIVACQDMPRELSFCGQAIMKPGETLIVPDTLLDPRFADSAAVTGIPHIRFYAGAPLIGIEGLPLGTLAVMDDKPREFDAHASSLLDDLAICVGAMLGLHRSAVELRESRDERYGLLSLNPHTPFVMDAAGRLLDVSPRIEALIGNDLANARSTRFYALMHPDDAGRVRADWAECRRAKTPYDGEIRFQLPDRTYRWFRAFAAPHLDKSGLLLNWFGTLEDIDERKRDQLKVEYLAYHDHLTGLLSRVRFQDLLKQSCASGRDGAPFAVFSLDLDDFKAVNNTFGHAVGDALLGRVAETLLACVGPSGLVARFGGDEFVFVQTGIADADAAAGLAEQILRALAEPAAIDGQFLSTGASMGIALCPRDGLDASRLIQSADLALYRAKAEESGSFRIFEPFMDEKVRLRQSLKIDLRHALDRDELALAYQPVVNLQTGRIDGFEALLRWQNPEHGLIAPDIFIPIAELSGMISQLGAWAMRHACMEARNWPDGIRVAVNLSPEQFNRDDLPRLVTEALAVSGLEPGRLDLEITETVALVTSEPNVGILQKLRALGIGLALDDFGTGYASLSYLQRFTFDRIKVDRSFVTRLSESSDARTIIRAIIGISRAFGITVTAEGIENQGQVDILRAEGCDQGQGYLFSSPVSADGVAALIAAFN